MAAGAFTLPLPATMPMQAGAGGAAKQTQQMALEALVGHPTAERVVE
jgi:hypothetical protein